MLDDFNTRVLLVVETSVETVAENQYVDALPFEILEVVQFQILRLANGGRHQRQRNE